MENHESVFPDGAWHFKKKRRVARSSLNVGKDGSDRDERKQDLSRKCFLVRGENYPELLMDGKTKLAR